MEYTAAEFADLLDVLKRSSEQVYSTTAASGLNFVWNVGSVAGQTIFHAHMHVVPRFVNEKFAGKSLRYWLKEALRSS